MRNWINILNEHTITKEEINSFMNRWGMYDGYVINDDLSVDVRGDVYLINMTYRKGSKKEINALPFKFRNVYGNFDIDNIGLTSMVNFPYYVQGEFRSVRNDIPNLIGSPSIVEGKYVINSVASLEGIAKEIYSVLHIANCTKLTSLKFLPKRLKSLWIVNVKNLTYWESRYMLFSELTDMKHLRFKAFGINEGDRRLDILRNYFNSSINIRKQYLPDMLQMFKDADNNVYTEVVDLL